ncbi:hypothetical protein [Ruegeria sp. A3M17]|uniref:hypothetical protein n=1 Tax=Ruegeria sp. A3M17 TaxID=2267229 RepID=UPI000DE8BA84|nr:hypothetical protein [Ruegeria sp. A3M17]RBW62528.1 hypothetical protein DS906_02410 [Ruegeria sp. A3M17]
MTQRPHIALRLKRGASSRFDQDADIESGLERRWGVDVSVDSRLEGEMSRYGGDFEAMLADLGPTSASRAGALSTRTGGQRVVRRKRKPQPELAGGMALMVARMHEVCKRDPRIPGAPSTRTLTRVLSHCLDQAQGRSGASLAAELNGRIKGGGTPTGGASALEASINRAAAAMAQPGSAARAQAFPLLAALLPMVKGLLPTLIPMLAPMLGNLLGGLAGGKSVASTASARQLGRTGGIDVSYGLAADGTYSSELALDSIVKVIMDLIPQLAPVFAKMISDAAPGVTGQIVKGLVPKQQPQPQVILQPVPVAAPAPSAAAAPAAPVAGPAPGGAPLLAQGMDASALAGLLGGAGGKIDPAMITGLLKNIKPEHITGLIQGVAGNAGGINQLMGGPGHELVKSVVERLPIEKMFDGKAWIPQINHDQFVSTLPWERVLSLSDAEGMVGQLFVPGRKMIKADRRIKLALPKQTMTDLGDGKLSWMFATDRPAKIPVSVTAGPERLDSPFLDIRVSCDGTPKTGLKRCVFRLAPLEAGASASSMIEIEPEVLTAASRHSGKICVSVRLVQKNGKGAEASFVGNEIRLCAHTSAPHRLFLIGAAPARMSDTFDDIPALKRHIPMDARANATHVSYGTRFVAAGAVAGLARHSPLTGAPGGAGDHLSGALEITPSGFADLARRLSPDTVTADVLAAIDAAMSMDPALRMQLGADAVERLPAGNQPLMVETVLQAAPAYLVSFDDVDENGNPARRIVRKIDVPIPAGIRIND